MERGVPWERGGSKGGPYEEVTSKLQVREGRILAQLWSKRVSNTNGPIGVEKKAVYPLLTLERTSEGGQLKIFTSLAFFFPPSSSGAEKVSVI